MANVYSNPTPEGKSSNEEIVKWEQNYVQFLKKNIKKRPLKKDELYETTFYGGSIAYKPDPTDSWYEMRQQTGNTKLVDST
ncbi:hypothetical protein JZU68_09165, partial [bacterium]|nr:hypothetical protein [bacterium]